MSPQELYPASSRYFSAPAVQGPMMDGVSPISGRSMYPSPTYNYGNPGFYDDPLQFPNCVALQTHNQVCEHTSILRVLAKYPAEHLGGTWRSSGPQGPDVRHRTLPSIHTKRCTVVEHCAT
jgi:hypothetical protein